MKNDEQIKKGKNQNVERFSKKNKLKSCKPFLFFDVLRGTIFEKLNKK